MKRENNWCFQSQGCPVRKSRIFECSCTGDLLSSTLTSRRHGKPHITPISEFYCYNSQSAWSKRRLKLHGWKDSGIQRAYSVITTNWEEGHCTSNRSDEGNWNPEVWTNKHLVILFFNFSSNDLSVRSSMGAQCFTSSMHKKSTTSTSINHLGF